MSVTGGPDDVTALLRGFNELDATSGRMIVIREVESIARKNPDDDTVKANVMLLGLHHKAAQE